MLKRKAKSNKIILSAYENLVDKVANFALPITDEVDLDDYLDEFFGVSESQLSDQFLNSDQEELFWEWFWYDLPFMEGDKTVIETYIVEHEETLTEEETNYLVGPQKSYRSCFRILEIQKSNGFYAEDLFTNEKFFITEIKGSRFFMVGDVLFARILPLKTRNVLPASITILKDFDLALIDKNLRLQQKFIDETLTRKEFLKQHGGVLYQQLFE